MAVAADLLIRARSDVGSALQSLGQLNAAMMQTSQRASALGQKSGGSFLGGFVGQAASFAAGLGVYDLARQGVSALGGAMVGTNADLEQANVAFTTLLGSGQAASSFLGQLATFAQSTPFRFPELVDASRRMLAYGFSAQQVVPLLTSVGDATSALGGGAPMMDQIIRSIGQMSAKGTVQAEEMMQLAEAGIPAWQMLADALGTDVATAMARVEARAVPATKMIQTFQQYASQHWGGMMQAQSQTFAGAMSNVADVLNMGIAQGFRPFFDVLRNGAVNLANFLMSPGFTAFTTNVAATSTALVAFGAAVAAIQIPDWVGTLALLVGAFVALNAVVVQAPLMFANLSAAIMGVIPALGGMMAAISPVTLVIAGLVAAGFLLYTAWTKNWGGIRDIVQSTVTNIISWLQNLLSTVGGFLAPIVGFLGGIAGEGAKAFLEGVGNVVGQAGSTLAPALDGVSSTVEQGFGDVLSTAGDLGNQAKAIVAGILPATIPGVQMPTVPAVPSGTAGAATSAASGVKQLKTALDAAKDSASETRDSLSAAKAELDRYSSASLIGEQALDAAMGANNARIAGLEAQKAQVQLDRLNRRPQRTGMRGIDQELQKLRLEQTVLGGSKAAYDEQHRQLQVLAKGQEEMGYAAAAAGIRASKGQVDALTQELAMREEVVKKLQKQYDLEQARAKGTLPPMQTSNTPYGEEGAYAVVPYATTAIPPATTALTGGQTYAGNALTLPVATAGTIGGNAPITLNITIQVGSVGSQADADNVAQKAAEAVLDALRTATAGSANAAAPTQPGMR